MSSFQQILKSMPPVTKNLIAVNVLVFLMMALVPGVSNGVDHYGALHYYEATDFNVAQLVTYMFVHGGFTHLLFNMFTLFMFGITLEYTLGSKRFLLFYMVCGVGAALIQEAVWSFTLPDMAIKYLAQANDVSVFDIQKALIYRPELLSQQLNVFTTVGASGAIYGVLLAFAMLYPNRPLYFMFIPVPVKAKYMAMVWIALELLLGLSTARDGIAHFAHLGGMIFGFMLIYYWKKTGKISGGFGGGY